MLRISVLLLFVLPIGITAKPLKPWDEHSNDAVEKGWVSIDDKGMASWGVEVEPPEDMDETSFDIDPSMRIWKSVQSEQRNKYQMAEADLDDMQHPSTENLLQALSAADMQVKDVTRTEETHDSRSELPLEPEEDWDELYHSEEEVRKYLAPLVVRADGAAPSEPELDEEFLYHADVDSGVRLVPLEPEVMAESQGRLYLEPEEDMDDIYHRDVPEMTLFNSEVDSVDGPMQKFTEPEEDLDAFYHE